MDIRKAARDMTHKILTNTQIDTPDQLIQETDRILALGSCFADRIGGRLEDLSWPGCANPCGVHFHPIGLARVLELCLDDTEVTQTDLIYDGDLYAHWMFGKRFADPVAELAVAKMNSALKTLRSEISNSQVLLVTWGTAWVYQHKEAKITVANCHRRASTEFHKRLLGVDEIVAQWRDILRRILSINPGLRCYFTVSPVRHLKDGHIQNQRSKSRLIEATHILCESKHHYFPAYEIMMDELRDYRWYAADMIHPSDKAVNYIFDKYCQTQMDSSAMRQLEALIAIARDMAHRPIHPESQATQDFWQGLISRISRVQDEHPHLDLSQSLSSVSQKIRRTV